MSLHRTESNKLAGAAISLTAFDMASLAAYFATLMQGASALIVAIAKFTCFPLAAAVSVSQAIIASRQYWIQKNEAGNRKQHLAVIAAIDALAATAVTTAVIIGLAVTTLTAPVAPIIFTSALAGKAIAKTFTALFNAGKASAHPRGSAENTKYRERAKQNAKEAFMATILGVAVGTILTLGHVALFPLGIAVSASLAVYGVTKLYDWYKNPVIAGDIAISNHDQQAATAESSKPSSPLLTYMPASTPSMVAKSNATTPTPSSPVTIARVFSQPHSRSTTPAIPTPEASPQAHSFNSSSSSTATIGIFNLSPDSSPRLITPQAATDGNKLKFD